MARNVATGALLVACVLMTSSLVLAQGTGGSREFRDCENCPDMVMVEGGEFRMGAPEEQRRRLEPTSMFSAGFGDEHPVRTITVRSFALAKYEVTVGQFATFVAATGYVVKGCNRLFPGPKFGPDPGMSWDSTPWSTSTDHPVSCVSWRDAQEYLRWLRKRTGKGYRLPSEAEWEYAARSGSQTIWPWGDDPDAGCMFANLGDITFKERFPNLGGPAWKPAGCRDGFVATAPVGRLKPNEFGVHDMIGNVYELVEDCVNGCQTRRIRGGSAWTRPGHARSASRGSTGDDQRVWNIGFRVARSLD